jgi:hypothetical protein
MAQPDISTDGAGPMTTATSAPNKNAPTTATTTNKAVDNLGEDTYDVDKSTDWLRKKFDLFHKFDSIPGTRNDAEKPIIMQLLIQAIYDFDDFDYKNYTQVLHRKFGIETLEDILNHFYFNQERWQQHVKIFTPRAKEHGDHVRNVHAFMESHLLEHYNSDLRDWFEKFEKKCREGKYEELSHVLLFWCIGVDKDGLNLYIGLRRTTRAENIHQKMRGSMGPWGLGAWSAHYLLLLLSYRYNISTGIRRCNEHDFGHPWLNYMDRIQQRVEEIWGVNIYPWHRNAATFEGTPDFVAVGIPPYGMIMLMYCLENQTND